MRPVQLHPALLLGLWRTQSLFLRCRVFRGTTEDVDMGCSFSSPALPGWVGISRGGFVRRSELGGTRHKEGEEHWARVPSFNCLHLNLDSLEARQLVLSVEPFKYLWNVLKFSNEIDTSVRLQFHLTVNSRCSLEARELPSEAWVAPLLPSRLALFSST